MKAMLLLLATAAVGVSLFSAEPVQQMRGKVVSVHPDGMVIREYRIETKIAKARPVEPPHSVSKRQRIGGFNGNFNAAAGPQKATTEEVKKFSDKLIFISGATNYPFASDVDLLVNRSGGAKVIEGESLEVFSLVQPVSTPGISISSKIVPDKPKTNSESKK